MIFENNAPIERALQILQILFVIRIKPRNLQYFIVPFGKIYVLSFVIFAFHFTFKLDQCITALICVNAH